jgi:palmitoyltransferase
MLWMLFIFLSVYAAQILFIFPSTSLLLTHMLIGILDALIISTFALTLMTLLSLLVTNCKDPGYISNRVDFMELLEKFDATQLCPECETLRTIRSRHCNVCHRCVERFDHHCPWINNCVGVYNHNWFITYLTAQYLLLGVTIANCLLSIFSGELALGRLAQIFDTGLSWQHDQMYFWIAFGGILFFSGLFFIPMNILYFVQVTNYLKGVTTNERFGRGANRHDSEYSEDNIE